MLGTTGRKTGLRRQTPLLYDEIEGCYYVGSARGENADWYLHLLANPRVTIRMVSHQFRAYTWPATDPEAAVDFIEQRLKGNSRPVGTLISLKGVGREPARDQLL